MISDDLFKKLKKKKSLMAGLSTPFSTQHIVHHFDTKEQSIPVFTLQSVANQSQEDTVASSRLLGNMKKILSWFSKGNYSSSGSLKLANCFSSVSL